MLQSYHSEDIIVISVIVLVISLVIWHAIIRSATNASTIVQNQKEIIRLMKLIAKKNGATDGEINVPIPKDPNALF